MVPCIDVRPSMVIISNRTMPTISTAPRWPLEVDRRDLMGFIRVPGSVLFQTVAKRNGAGESLVHPAVIRQKGRHPVAERHCGLRLREHVVLNGRQQQLDADR